MSECTWAGTNLDLVRGGGAFVFNIQFYRTQLSCDEKKTPLQLQGGPFKTNVIIEMFQIFSQVEVGPS